MFNLLLDSAGRSVSNKTPIRHVGLHEHVEVFDGSPTRHVGLRWSMSRSLMGHRSGMLVSDGSPIGFRK